VKKSHTKNPTVKHDGNPKSFIIKLVTWCFDRIGRNRKGRRMPDWSSLWQKLPGPGYKFSV